MEGLELKIEEDNAVKQDCLAKTKGKLDSFILDQNINKYILISKLDDEGEYICYYVLSANSEIEYQNLIHQVDQLDESYWKDNPNHDNLFDWGICMACYDYVIINLIYKND